MNSKNDKQIEAIKLAINTKVVLFKEDMLSSLGDFIARMIRVRTRLGYGVNGNSKKKLKALKESTIEQREREDLYEETTPRRSNLTRSGQMLNSITKKITKINFLTVLVPKTDRSDSDKTNADIAYYNELKGRKFFALTDSEINQIKREAVKLIKSKNLTKFKT